MGTVNRVKVGGEDYFSFGATPSGLSVFHRYNAETGLLSRMPHVTQSASGELHATDADKQKVSVNPVAGDGTIAARGSRGKKLTVVTDVFKGGLPVYARGNEAANIVSGKMPGEPLSPRTARHVDDGGTHRLAGQRVSPMESIPTPSHIAALRPQPALAPAAAASSSGGSEATEHKDGGEGF